MKIMQTEITFGIKASFECALEYLLGTVDKLVIDNAIMDEVREKQRNLSVAFYDYQKAYDMVQHDWMLRVYRWMGVPEKVVNVIRSVN